MKIYTHVINILLTSETHLFLFVSIVGNRNPQRLGTNLRQLYGNEIVLLINSYLYCRKNGGREKVG